jgi:hypothetical protein
MIEFLSTGGKGIDLTIDRMSFTPSIVATLATQSALPDLHILLKSLDFWNTPAPTVYLFCDAPVAAALPSIAYKGRLVIKECLNDYTHLNRADMERLPGRKYKNLFFDFVCEKLSLLEWALSFEPTGALFCDADICFLAPLFKLPEGTTLAVSAHGIRSADETKYGIYNAGMLWVKDATTVEHWRVACSTSSFYEQIAIEDVVATAKQVYQLPVTENYGWWRLWQGQRSASDLQREWGMNRNTTGSGITILGAPLGSVHTHFREQRDVATVQYNEWVLSWLRRIAKSHAPTRRFMSYLNF